MKQTDPQPAGLIANDRLCWRCRYNLRGLSTPGRCPECSEAIDLSRYPPSLQWKPALAWSACIWIAFLLASTVFLDVAFAASLFLPFLLKVILLGAVVALPTWAITRRKAPLIILTILVAVVLILPFTPTGLPKSFRRFFNRVRHGMTPAQVLEQLDATFPNRVADGHPRIAGTPSEMTIWLGPQSGPYNAEVISIHFTGDKVVRKRYTFD